MASVSRDHFQLPMGTMANTAPGNLPRGERIKIELREFAILATYLFVYFSALAGFKGAILSAEGISFSPWLFALIKALVCAKSCWLDAGSDLEMVLQQSIRS